MSRIVKISDKKEKSPWIQFMTEHPNATKEEIAEFIEKNRNYLKTIERPMIELLKRVR